MNPNQVIRSKNPLLSCAVTGGFEEFTGSGIVLAAAEKPVFTIGTPAISDTDNFSDVSLDRDGTSETPTPAEPLSFYSPLAELDSMGNLQNVQGAPTLDLSQDQQHVDANLNPISAALAQLPNAASTVFSTFSNIIKGSTSQPRMEEQQPYDASASDLPQAPVNPYGYMYASNPDPAAPPPSFFSPTDESLFKKTSAEPALNNTFRMGGNKKKTYAHIPGLSTNNQTSIAPQTFNPNPVMPPLPPQPVAALESLNQYQDYQPPPHVFGSQQQPHQYQQASPPQNQFAPLQAKEPEKSKFSLTSLLPSQLLEKIPSTKHIFGSSEPSYDQQHYNHNDIQDFSVMTSIDQPLPEAANFFNPNNTNAPFAVGHQQEQSFHQSPPPAVNFFNPQQFNTSPFAPPKVVADQNEVKKETVPVVQSIPFSAPEIYQSTPISEIAPPPMTAVPASLFNQTTFSPIPFSNSSISQASNEPPKIDAISADTNCPPPTFFNPIEASQMFKAGQSDDGRPKNPYSSSRISRGVGLYKTRTAMEIAQAQPDVMPPMPATNSPAMAPMPSSMSSMPAVLQHLPAELPPMTTTFMPAVVQPTLFADTLSNSTIMFSTPAVMQPVPAASPSLTQFAPLEQQKIPSRPPSIPPLPAVNNYGLPPRNESIPTLGSTEIFQLPVEQSQQMPLHVPAPIEAPPANSLFFNPPDNLEQSNFGNYHAPLSRKKSDLNVPEIEPQAPMNFFESSQPIVSHFENGQLSTSIQDTTSAINFFQQPIPSAPEMSFKTDYNTTANTFFENDSTTQTPLVPTLNEDLVAFDSPIANSTVQSSNNELNDMSDKLDSLSLCDNVGSTLSLFATSELDATATQKFPFDSLIPKYLDEQAATVNARTTSSPAPAKNYRPVYRHWFYQKLYWHPFAMSDSLALDEALEIGKEAVVTDGGRFEVDLKEKRRSSIYWSSGSNAVRRCSWFFKNPNGAESNLIPFDEETAELMESEYEKATLNNSWNHEIQLPNAQLLMKDPTNIEYIQHGFPLVVKRGVDEFVIDDGEEASVDHLIISVSSFGDKIDDSADELRSKCSETIQHYYSEAYDCGQVGRVEVLPISLNSVDVLKMKDTHSIIEAAPGGIAEMTESSTYLDIIMKTSFYCNQEYYQNIMNHLAFSMNEIVTKFRQRNPDFKGEISLIATSFEALFLFDLLMHQETAPAFWKLKFEAANFYAFGMPTNLLTIRNGAKLQTNFVLSNCRKFLNVVHRLDPIAQRIEPLIRHDFSSHPPESIENESVDRIDYTIADGSSLESFSLKNYFTSELIILRITNEIYGALKMDSGSL